MPEFGAPSAEKKPKGFWPLVFTEFWERFSFYGLQAILTYYLLYSLKDGGLALNPSTAVAIVGAYGGGVYVTQLVGGWLADRVIRPQNLVIYGSVIIICGHLSLASVPGLVGVGVGLPLIALGTGALKSNITAIIGMSMKSLDATQRDSGFTFYYAAINLGILIGPTITGFLQQDIGFHIAFGCAAVGMFISLLQYTVKRHSLPDEARIVRDPASRQAIGVFIAAFVAVAVLLVIAVSTGLVSTEHLSVFIGIAAAGTAGTYFFVIIRSKNTSSAEKSGLIGYIPMWITEVFYQALLLQIFTTVPLIVTERVDRNILGWDIPVGWFLTFGAIFGLSAQGLMASVGKNTVLGRASATRKFRIAMLGAALSYLMLLPIAWYSGPTVPAVLVLASIGAIFCVETFLAPIGFSIVSKVGPERYRTQLFALKHLALAVGSTLATAASWLYIAIGIVPFALAMGGIALFAVVVLSLFSSRIEYKIGVGMAPSSTLQSAQ